MRVIKMAATTALVLGAWSAACGVASADPPTPAPTPPPAPKTSIDADGIYKVGTDIAPGTYASAGPVNNGTCSWKRATAANETIDNALTKKAQVVAIEATDATFKTSGCQAWSLTDASPPASVGNLQPQAALAMLNGLMGGGGFMGSGGGAAPAPAAAPAPTATGPLPGPAAAPAPAPTGPLPGPAAEPTA
jgi:hypothetical protein